MANFEVQTKIPGKLPQLTKLAKVLGSRGIDVKDSVIIVHDGVTTTDFGAAARVYWTLKSVGFDSLAILNGGFRAYKKDGFELASGDTIVSQVFPQLEFNPTWYADTAEVEKHVSGKGSARLLDARLDEFMPATHGTTLQRALGFSRGPISTRLRSFSIRIHHS